MNCPGCQIILCKNDGCDWLVIFRAFKLVQIEGH